MRGACGEEQKVRMSLVEREVFLMNPVVMRRAWIWFTSIWVLQIGRRTSVGSVEFHGWFEIAQTNIKVEVFGA